MKTAAASTMRGLSAAYWLLKTNPWMKAGDTILLHAAAGGVGLIAVQWAKLLGLRVIGTVSTEEKAAIATGARLRRNHLLSPRKCCRAGQGADRRRRRHHRLRHGRQGHVRRLAEVAEAPRRAGRLRHRVRARSRRSTRCSWPSRARSISRGRRWPTISPIRRSAPSCRAPCSTISPAAGSRSRSTSGTSWRTPRRRIAISRQGRRPARRSSPSDARSRNSPRISEPSFSASTSPKRRATTTCSERSARRC